MARMRANRLRGRRLAGLGLGLLVTLVLGASRMAQGSRHQAGYFFDVRSIPVAELGLHAPAGLAYMAEAQALLVLQESNSSETDQAADLAAMDLNEEIIWTTSVPALTSARSLMAFDEPAGTLLLLDQRESQLIQVALPGSVVPAEAMQAVHRLDLSSLGLQEPRAMAVDPQDGALYLLEGRAREMVRMTRPAVNGQDSTRAVAGVERLTLEALPAVALQTLAFDPTTRHLFVLDSAGRLLFELDEARTLVATRDLSTLQLHNPQAMAFAPSGDPTDDPDEVSLYVADAGEAEDRGTIIEISLTPPTLLAKLPALSTNAFLVQTIDTSLWSPPSPDPAGIAFHWSLGRFLVADSEVNEMEIYEGVNVYQMNPAGNLLATCDTTSFSREPTGVAVNPVNQHIFFSDDNQKVIHEVNPGPDGAYCTADDTVTSFSTKVFGSNDPEGVAFGAGLLYIADGVGQEVYVVAPGPNGIFDGIPPAGDDIVTHWDVETVGLRDPEGIGYHPQTGTLFIASRNTNFIAEMTIEGEVVALIDVAFLNTRRLAGADIGPGSEHAAVLSVYLTDRGVDNNDDPDENDGKIYEINLGREVPPTATATATATATVTTTPNGEPAPTATSTVTPDGPPPSLPVRAYLPLVRR